MAAALLPDPTEYEYSQKEEEDEYRAFLERNSIAASSFAYASEK
jgi:hypothetical protein